ncbi:type II secretion system F family protein [Candidatus Peregrinibacteria bacterium]|nr:type II secretion system F family protein [Candidatus Peregrinibacteria bacterium]
MEIQNKMSGSEKKAEKSADVSARLLKNIEKKGKRLSENVVYGVYDNRNASIFTKINDFFIDHSRISLKEKAYFFHLMAVMIDAGIPVLKTLQILTNKTENVKFQRIINTLAYSASQGVTLSDAMARFPDVFSDADIGVIKAGEAAGNLNKMLLRLSEQTEKSHDLQTKLFTAATYPAFIFATLLVIATAMMIWIVPILTNLLKEGGLPEEEFPVATKALIGISNFLGGYWWTLILVVVIIYALLHVYKGTTTGKFQLDYLKLRIPVVGELIRKVLVLRFVSLLGILIEAGLPVIKILQIIGGSINNELYRIKTWEIIKEVQAGKKISENLKNSSFLFPETVTQMLNIGETSASLGSISQKIAQHYDKEIDNTLKRLTTLFEPIMMLVVGLVVALLALSILMPIFDLTRLV